jgi:hypothetical protein
MAWRKRFESRQRDRADANPAQIPRITDTSPTGAALHQSDEMRSIGLDSFLPPIET